MLSICSNCIIKLSEHQKNPERISKIKPFINQYNWKEISFPSHKKDWKKFELNNKLIALNIFYVPYNAEEIRHAYKPKYNLKDENQVFLLMITDFEKRHYLYVTNIASLLRGGDLKLCKLYSFI